jgi:hypothetical protein
VAEGTVIATPWARRPACSSPASTTPSAASPSGCGRSRLAPCPGRRSTRDRAFPGSRSARA